MITDKDVRDLRAGDVIAMQWPSGATLQGVLTEERIDDELSRLLCGGLIVRHTNGNATHWGRTAELRVLKRAPEPMYVNHPREEPVMGDVARLSGNRPTYSENLTWAYDGREWRTLHSTGFTPIVTDMPRELVLLVDGTTGRVVP